MKKIVKTIVLFFSLMVTLSYLPTVNVVASPSNSSEYIIPNVGDPGH